MDIGYFSNPPNFGSDNKCFVVQPNKVYRFNKIIVETKIWLEQIETWTLFLFSKKIDLQ